MTNLRLARRLQDGRTCSSLTRVDFLVSLKKVFLNEAHIALAAMVGLLTWSMMSIVEKKLQTKQTNKPSPMLSHSSN